MLFLHLLVKLSVSKKHYVSPIKCFKLETSRFTIAPSTRLPSLSPSSTSSLSLSPLSISSISTSPSSSLSPLNSPSSSSPSAPFSNSSTSEVCNLLLTTCNLLFRDEGSFFMVGGLSKNVGRHGWPMLKNWKKTVAKMP